MKRSTAPSTSSPSAGGSGGIIRGTQSTSRRRGGAGRKAIPLFAYLVLLPLMGIIFMIQDIITHHDSSLENQDSQQEQLRKQVTVVEDPNTRTTSNTIVVASTGAKLPSAKSLLTKAPPFKDSDIIKLSHDDNMILSSPNTVVTAYYKIPSKFKPSKYNGWMKNMLSLQDAMVVFTSNDLIPSIKEFRQHALNRTVIVPLELNDLPIGTSYTKDFWSNQLERDPEKGIHRSYELFWIWLSKTWWVNQAIRLNPYNSDLFMWSDIGCFRDARYNYKQMIVHRDQIPPTEMVQMAHHKPNPPPDLIYYNDKYSKAQKPHFYHSGSQMAAYLETWKRFHSIFLDTIDQFLIRNMIIIEDQAILESVCLREPTICAYVPFDQVKPNDNHYFGLRYVTRVGGTYNLWRQSVDAGKIATEKQLQRDKEQKIIQ